MTRRKAMSLGVHLWPFVWPLKHVSSSKEEKRSFFADADVACNQKQKIQYCRDIST
jgi:hypothetical protein